MILDILLILLGFGFLIKGADWLVVGSSAFAKKHNVSDLVIGLTIVAFGTSAPELVVNVIASFDKHSDIVFGNVIGSNNFNLFVILGLSALLFPVAVKRSMVKKEIPFSLAVTLLLMILANKVLGQKEYVLSTWDAVILLLVFTAFLYFTFKNPETTETEDIIEEKELTNFKIWFFILIGLGLLIAGGRFVVNSAVALATDFGVSEKVIGLTIVAAGTSLPELLTSIMAAYKKKSDIAIGNVIGSNIFNILFILGVSGLIHPIAYNPKFNLEILLLIGGTLWVIFFTFLPKKNRIDRWNGAVLLIIFAAYTVFMLSQEA